MRGKLRFGVVGMGRMGITHLAILRPREDLECVGIAEPNKLVRDNVRKHLGLDVFRDVESLLEAQHPDFVVITSPTEAHASAVAACVRAGAHVFVEKPLTADPAESQRLADLAESEQRVGQVGYVNRFNAAFRKAQEIMASGVLGTVQWLTSDMRGGSMAGAARGGWRSRGKGGGVLLDYGSHALDLVTYLAGTPEEVLWSRCQSMNEGGAEDIVDAALKLPGGGTCMLHLDWTDASYRKPLNRLELRGTNGRLIAMQHEVHLFLRKAADGYREGWSSWYAPELAKGVRFYLRGNEFTEQLDAFVDRVAAHRSGRRDDSAWPAPTLREGAAIDHLLGAIRAGWGG